MSSEGQIGFYPSFIEALICLWTSQDDSSFWGRVRIQDRCHLALLGTPLLLCLSHPFSFFDFGKRSSRCCRLPNAPDLQIGFLREIWWKDPCWKRNTVSLIRYDQVTVIRLPFGINFSATYQWLQYAIITDVSSCFQFNVWDSPNAAINRKIL